MKQQDFLNLGYSAEESIMLADAHKGITKAGLWDYFALPTTPGKDGFMFSTDIQLVELNKFMKYDGHSASSYSWTMKQMETLAKHGIEALRRKPRVTIPPTPATFEEMKSETKPKRKSSMSALWEDFVGDLEHSRDPNLRQQGSFLRRFEKGEISPAEMQSRFG
jgi:hypothetical protein